MLAAWRINAEALDDNSVATLAGMIAKRSGPFSSVHGVPTGGVPLARSLEPYRSNDGPLLIVDDVLTTWSSMEEFRDGSDAIGFVVFDRSEGQRPAWIKALWTLEPKVPKDGCQSVETVSPTVDNWPSPTESMLDDPVFSAIWQFIKGWDISVPNAYEGYMGATGNHVRAILEGIRPLVPKAPELLLDE